MEMSGSMVRGLQRRGGCEMDISEHRLEAPIADPSGAGHAHRIEAVSGPQGEAQEVCQSIRHRKDLGGPDSMDLPIV